MLSCVLFLEISPLIETKLKNHNMKRNHDLSINKLRLHHHRLISSNKKNLDNFNWQNDSIYKQFMMRMVLGSSPSRGIQIKLEMHNFIHSY